MSLSNDKNGKKRDSAEKNRQYGRREKNTSSAKGKKVRFEPEVTHRDSKAAVSEEEKFFNSYSRFGSSISEKHPEKRTKAKKDESTPQTSAKIRELNPRQRKIRTTVLYIVMFVVIVAAAFAFSFTIIFKTNNIEVIGETPYTAEQIIDASGLHNGDNIFLSRKKAAARNIVDTFPYIESAEITFKIPGTQVIKVEGAIPSYEVSINGGYVVVSSKGRVLAHNEERTQSIPLLKGVRVKDTEVGAYIKFEKSATQQILADLINSINDNDIPGIYGIDISNAANIKLNYGNRITILLGVPEDVGYKLRTAMAIIENELSETDKGDLDVSLANSDRKASYFTPIYSNTITIEETVKSTDSDNPNNSSGILSEGQ